MASLGDQVQGRYAVPELDGLASSESDAGESSERGLSVTRRRILSLTAMGVLLALACLLGVALLWSGPSLTPRRSADKPEHSLESSVQFDALHRKALDGVPTKSLAAMADAAQAAIDSTGASGQQLTPAVTLDGNPCAGNEELFEGLCYHKCSLLTEGKDPIRSSPWSCCSEPPCLVPSHENFKVGLQPVCSGYDVNGAGGCPHKPGSCLVNEELHLGQCYEKCAILTNGAFPHRVAAATCCKTDGWGCIDPRNDKTSAAFAVGGGVGDHDPSTPATVHAPEESPAQAAAEASAEASSKAAAVVATGPPRNKPELAVFQGSKNCSITEELYGGLCYRKCNLLTYGEYPIRTSSWTCCAGHPCGLFNEKGEIGHSVLCNGFDISGDGKCPSAPGGVSCAVDEEDFLGVCYGKCSMLTKGEFPYRIAAATCCKTQNKLGCLNFLKNDMTSDSFNVGSAVAPATEASSAFMMRK